MALTKVGAGIIDDAPVGIHSGGTLIHSASTDLNFVGTGHTFTVNGGTTILVLLVEELAVPQKFIMKLYLLIKM